MREPPRQAVSSPVSGQENPLDVDVPPRRAPAPPVPTPRPPPRRKVRTPADEDLPPWVPKAGRLTVVSACDLAENLGLVPLGTARRGECPDARALLEAEQARP